MVSLVWGVHPVTLSGHFSLAATLYFVAGASAGGGAEHSHVCWELFYTGAQQCPVHIFA